MQKCSVNSEEKNFPECSSELEQVQRKNDEIKNNLTNALLYCKSLLEAENLLTNTPSEQMSAASIAMGEEIFKEIIFMLEDRKIVTDEVLICAEDADTDNEYEFVDCTGEPNSSDSSDFEPEEFHPSREFENISLSYKERVVALADMHPRWTLRTLQRRGCSRLKSMKMLRIWRDHVKRGGTMIDKWKCIETQTFERFQEAREYLDEVTTRTLQQWAMAISLPLLSEDFQFFASHSWIKRFKQKYKIKRKKITRFVSSREYPSLKEILEAAERFQTQTKAIMSEFDLDFVINTDQMGCQYQMLYNQSLIPQHLQNVLPKKKSLHDTSQLYTVQYSITASGKLLPVVFLCMQEPLGKFNPTVQRNINTLMTEYKNVFVTCSKSGKLTKLIYMDYLKYCLSPYVETNKFLLLIDSWSDQTDTTLYDDIFEDETGKASCTIKVIPSKCASLCQPCDVYLHQQIKSFIKRLQICSPLLQEHGEINTREDAIKIHSLILHQLSAPVFKPMLLYAWFTSKLIEDQSVFLNVNEVCFSVSILKEPCACQTVGFIQCAHCKKILCFDCFYNSYHPKMCEMTKDSKENSENE